MNLPNVTLSNMSHLVYITLFGETDGVTLSSLGCSIMWKGRRLSVVIRETQTNVISKADNTL